jgi:hypothetical protein
VVNIIELHTVIRHEHLVFFNWVRAHNGDPFNDRADMFAKRAPTIDGVVGYHHLPISHFKYRLQHLSQQQWNRQWQTSNTGRNTHKYFPTFQSRKKAKYTSYNLTQFLTGHGDFKEYLHRFLNKDTPYCGCSPLAEDTAEHQILRCPKFISQRDELFNGIGTVPDRENIALSALVTTPDAYRSFVHFVNNICADKSTEIAAPQPTPQ